MARRMAAWAGMLALSVAGFGAVGRAQEPRGPAPDRAKGRAERAERRPKLAALRAEVDLLRIEHEASVGVLKPLLVDLLNVEAAESARAEVDGVMADLKGKFPAGVGPVGAGLLQTMARLGITPPDEAEQKAVDAATARLVRSAAGRLKKEILRRAATLHGRELELEEAEADYRAASPAAGPKLSGVPGVTPVAVEGLHPIAEEHVVSVPAEPPLSAPGLPFLVEDTGPDVEPAGSPDPPTVEEIWDEIDRKEAGPRARPGPKRANTVVRIEKVGEMVDPCKVYPLAGPCELVRRRYRCIVSFDEAREVPGAPPKTERRVEVVAIDKAHLRRCAGLAPPSDPTVKAASGSSTRVGSDLDRRVEAIEMTLDRLRERLDPSKPATPR